MSTQAPQQADPQQNELAHWMFNFQRKIEPHTNKIVLAIIVGTIAIVAFQVMSRSAAAKKSEAWSKYAACTTADDFQDVADDHAGTDVEGWARLEAARGFVRTGVSQSMTNRKASTESLENAKTQLEKLLNSTTTPSEVREQALVQMAVCLESLSDGDVKPATEAYDRLLKEFPNTFYASWAKSRLEALKRPDAAEFYAWFQKAQPAPPERPKPQDVKPSDLPNIKLDGEDLTPPSATTPAGTDREPASPDAPAAEAPATESKPAEEAPEAPEATTGEKPAEAPAAAAPSAETPAAEAPATEAPAAPPAETPAAEAPPGETPAPATPEAPAAEKPAEPAPEAPKQ